MPLGEMPERTSPPRGGRYTLENNRRTGAVGPWEIHFFLGWDSRLYKPAVGKNLGLGESPGGLQAEVR
jgi:hypothetical protein